jgi:hypothetical protein
LHSQLGIWPCKLLLSMLRFVSDARLDTEMQAARVLPPTRWTNPRREPT